VLLAALLLIRETLPPERRHGAGGDGVRARYGRIFRDRVFIGVALIAAMSFSGVFAYISSSSFLFQEIYGMDAQQYGIVFAINSMGIVIGTQSSSRIARRVGPQWVLACSTAVLLAAPIAIIVLTLADVGILGVLVPLFFFITAVGFGFPMVQVLALVNHGSEAGTAASLLGALNFGIAGLVSPIVGFLGVSALAMAGVMATTASIAVLSLWLIVRPRTVPDIGD